MALEIERKFLCRWVNGTPDGGTPIVQAYLVHGSPEIRIRTTGPKNDAELTIKRGHGLSRSETNVPIPHTAAVELLHEREGDLVVKTRHKLGRWEVDEYEGHFKGYMSAECELTSEDEPLPTPPPEIQIIKEVTGDPRYSNSAISKMDEAAARELGAEYFRALTDFLNQGD